MITFEVRRNSATNDWSIAARSNANSYCDRNRDSTANALTNPNGYRDANALPPLSAARSLRSGYGTFCGRCFGTLH